MYYFITRIVWQFYFQTLHLKRCFLNFSSTFCRIEHFLKVGYWANGLALALHCLYRPKAFIGLILQTSPRVHKSFWWPRSVFQAQSYPAHHGSCAPLDGIQYTKQDVQALGNAFYTCLELVNGECWAYSSLPPKPLLSLKHTALFSALVLISGILNLFLKEGTYIYILQLQEEDR